MHTLTMSALSGPLRQALRLAALGGALVCAAAQATSQTEALVSACADGEMEICRQLSLASFEQQGPQSPLEARAALFAGDPEQAELVEAMEPDLKGGYGAVVAHYFATPGMAESARERYFLPAALSECGAHYHEVWALERGWWPTDAEDRPVWPLIYMHMLDHYFGYCVPEHGTGRRS